MPASTASGGCLCGNVRYSVDDGVKPLQISYCHCSLCRRASGAPVVAWVIFPASAVHFVDPSSLLTDFHSSETAFRQFCRGCGTQLAFRYQPGRCAPGVVEEVDLTVASLDDPSSVQPTHHIYTSTRIPWFDTSDALPRHSEGWTDRGVETPSPPPPVVQLAMRRGGSFTSGPGRSPLLADTSPTTQQLSAPPASSPTKDKVSHEPFHTGSLNQLDDYFPPPGAAAAAPNGPPGRSNFVSRTLKQASHMMSHMRLEGAGGGGGGGLGPEEALLLPSYSSSRPTTDEPGSSSNPNSAAADGGGLSAGGMGGPPLPPPRGGRHSSVAQLAQLNAEYDVSDAMLRQAFDTLDHENKGTLSYEQVQSAILQLESLKNLPRSQLNALLRSFDKFKGTTCEQFVGGIQDFVTSLYKEGEGAVQECFLCDYSKNELSFRPIKSTHEYPPVLSGGLPMTMSQLFTLEPALAPNETVRWISIVGVNVNVIMSLATKFGIHHLMVEDVIGSRLERPKLEVVGHVKHILLSHIYVDTHGALQKCRTHIFLVGENTVIFIQNGPSQVNEQIQLKLKTSMSKLRLSGASFLVYSLVDSLVNEMQLVLQDYLNLLKSLHHVSVSTAKVKELFHVTRDLAMFTVWIAPVAQIIHKLQDGLTTGPSSTTTAISMTGRSSGDTAGMISPDAVKAAHRAVETQELQVHLMDLAQNVMALHEEINLVTRWAESKSRELDSLQQLRTSKVVLLLTLLTAAFLPLQLLAAIAGMNFKHMPLIDDEWGFPLFWIVGLSTSVLLLAIFKLKRWF